MLGLPRILTVMPGLVPGIHVFSDESRTMKTWMAGTSPAMTHRLKREPLSQAAPLNLDIERQRPGAAPSAAFMRAASPIAAVAGVWKSPTSRSQSEDMHYANMDCG
jgi:hypothetical protein